jgi:hypothetical protein
VYSFVDSHSGNGGCGYEIRPLESDEPLIKPEILCLTGDLRRFASAEAFSTFLLLALQNNFESFTWGICARFGFATPISLTLSIAADIVPASQSES